MTTEQVLLIAGISVGTLVFSLAIAGWLLIRIPPDYFKDEKRRAARKRPLWLKILKNAGGVLLVGIGLVVSVPGGPGQGLLLVLAGMMTIRIPGKYRVERKILLLRPVRKAADRLRAWRGRPPLEFPKG